jgi:uncharacterized protein with ParB-like and HNH nuclease domain
MIDQDTTPIRVGLLDLLRKSIGSQFVIPVYQRNYTWTADKDVKQLLIDLEAVITGERTKHFIGIMIYLEKSINPFEQERSVIDGQQRLTTIFLILYAIKDLMLEKGFIKDAKALESTYLVNLNTETIKFKLKPLVSDDIVYRQIISGEFDRITEKKSNVYKNYFYIKEYLKTKLAVFSYNDILLALNKLYIVCVPIGMDDYPQKVFESINATGAKLTASDLIRNYMLMPIQSENQEMYYSTYWKKIEALIDSDARKLESFFRFFIMAKKRESINKSIVYQRFIAWYEEVKSEYGDEWIFKEVTKYAEYYNDIYKKPVDSIEAEMRSAISEFRCILSEMPAPMLIELYSLHKTIDTAGHPLISAKDFGSIISILNSYLMRRSLCGMDTSDVSRYFPTLLKETLADCDGNYKNIVEIFKKDLINRNKGNSQEMPDDKTVFDRIVNANMYNLRLWVNIFFRKLESENNSAVVDFSKLSIEHLMPQTPSKLWYDILGVSSDDYNENLHRLGNLTFASKVDNSKMGNKIWEYKTDILSTTSHLKINQAILSKDKWTIKDIDERTKDLISDINRLYPFLEAKGAVIEKIPIYIQLLGVSAQGTYFPDNGGVEIEVGSELVKDISNFEPAPSIDGLRAKLIEDEIISDSGDKLVFNVNYTFYGKYKGSTALSSTACLILYGSRNGWEYWVTEDGTPLSKVQGLKGKKDS